MSIFLDPTVVAAKRAISAAAVSPKNTCGPNVTGCDTCGPLPYQPPAVCATTVGCVALTPAGIRLPDNSDNSRCSPSQLQSQLADNQYINSLANENLNLGGADACVFKLLGVHQQGTLIDVANNGCAISSDFREDHPPDNAFDRFATDWESVTTGVDVTASWIGYDFGLRKRTTGVLMYSPEANAEARKHITTIAIKQGGDSINWVGKVRLERSDDGTRWHGVDIVTLQMSSERVVYNVKQSVPARMWRIRPITGHHSTDRWKVSTFEMFEFVVTDLANIQDSPLFVENRDRSYCINPVKIKVFYDLINISTELSRFGIDLPTATLTLTVNFSEAVKQLGRGVIIGDVLEIPSEMQFTSDMQIVRKYVEVSDVTWSTVGYTPGWAPLFQQVTARPMLARQEVLDIVGKLEADIGDVGDGYHTNNMFSELALQANEAIQIAADQMLPQLGQDAGLIADITELPIEHVQAAVNHGVDIEKLVTNYSKPTKLQDNASYRTAMPPAGTKSEMFTMGDHGIGFPDNPKNGQYHRMSYESLTAEKIPPKLYRYSLAKNRWIFLESDDRYEAQTNKTRLKSYLVDDDRTSLQDVK